MSSLQQSPEWDVKTPLAQLLVWAKFFILLKRESHGDLVAVVVDERKDGLAQMGYACEILSHDRYGVTCPAQSWFSPADIQKGIEKGTMDITADPAVALQHIWEVMNCHPNTEKLFTEYETVVQ